jgi:broad specificity phosphatase PhoE
MLIYLIRHGEPQGPGDTPLSDRGVQQAERVAKRLSRFPLRKIYCSDLLRARQTASAFEITHPNSERVMTPALQELYRVLVGGAPKGGTSPHREEEDRMRIESFLRDFASDSHAPGDVAIITHGNVIRFLIARGLGIDPGLMRSTHVHPGSISLLQTVHDGMTLKLFNNVEHLGTEDLEDFYNSEKSCLP